MTRFERSYLLLEPFMPPLYRHVRARLMRALAGEKGHLRILDVGGRKSHYTIGVPARVTISDLPRETELQHRMHLGINDEIAQVTAGRRSNVETIVYDDMTRSGLEDATFDLVVAVEVLEHVERDEDFVANVYRVLRPGGQFLMTTPNGDSVANTNPDHKRHYTRAGLQALLGQYFRDVRVEYAIPGGLWRKLGLKSWSLRRPVQTLASMIGNVVNGWQAASRDVGSRANGTRHLIAVAAK